MKISAAYKGFIIYILKFGIVFAILYFGTVALIGISTPDDYYSPFAAKYLNYIDWLRATLLLSTKEMLSWFGYQTYLVDKYDLVMKGGGGIRMVYSCIGYGVMSFWAAFVIANTGRWMKKITWILIGWTALYIINVLRLSILIVAIHKHWAMPLGWDHHTWFNIVAYLLIFLLIYFYDRSTKILYARSDYPKPS